MYRAFFRKEAEQPAHSAGVGADHAAAHDHHHAHDHGEAPLPAVAALVLTAAATVLLFFFPGLPLALAESIVGAG